MRKILLIITLFAISVVILDFIVKDGQWLEYYFDNTPKAAVPSSREQIDIYKWWVDQHPKGLVVVDVGCGTGSVVNAIGKANNNNVEVCGFDIDKSCIKKARLLYPSYKFWVADMIDFQPISDNRPICYIIYEPLWQYSHSSAYDLYKKFFTRIILHDGNVSVVYVSGSRPFYPKTHLFDTSYLKDIGFLQVYSKNIGSLLARRSCKIFTYNR